MRLYQIVVSQIHRAEATGFEYWQWGELTLNSGIILSDVKLLYVNMTWPQAVMQQFSCAEPIMDQVL